MALSVRASPRAGGPAAQWVTLITGDRIAVDSKGKPVDVRRADGREKTQFLLSRIAGHSYVIPSDAIALVQQGRLDKKLFDVTERSRPQYRRAAGDAVPVIVTYRGGSAPAARNHLRAADAGIGRQLPAVAGESMTAKPSAASAIWKALTDPVANGRTASAAGINKVYLDAVRRVNLDKSARQIGADKAWAKSFTGKGVKIAVLDTGVDQIHPDLAGTEAKEKNFSDSRDNVDRYGHGTHVASIAAGTGKKSGGKYRGIASGAKILDGKVLNDKGEGADSGIIAAMQWAVGEKAKVVNLSLGGEDLPGIDPLEAAVNSLSRGAKAPLFVIAAGNEGPRAGTVGSPGSADAALTVAAVDRHDKIAEFSSRGPRVGDSALKPDLAAPGVAIAAAKAAHGTIGDPVAPGYVALDGTSMAAPHTAGAAAILAGQHPTWSGQRIKAALIGSAKAMANTQAFAAGSGRLDIGAAITRSVIAETPSLSFGLQRWPHTDDRPATRTITYRNTGTRPVTLKLKTTGLNPKGRPAPAGFFKLSATTVTVPARGTASAELTVSTRLGGTAAAADGSYSGYVTATGGGQSVRTAAAVEREVESYDLTVKHIGRDGQPARQYASTVFDLRSGESIDLAPGSDDPSAPSKLRLPKGEYFLDGRIYTGSPKNWDLVVQPSLKLTKDSTVSVDGRTTEPIEITAPKPAAKLDFAAVEYAITGSGASYTGGLVIENAPEAFSTIRTAHRGPAVPASMFSSDMIGQWLVPGTEESYTLAFQRSKSFYTGFRHHTETGELATADITMGSSLAGKIGGGFLTPEMPDSSWSLMPRGGKLPRKHRMHFNGKAATWWVGGSQIRSNGDWPEMEYLVPGRTYAPGSTTRFTFNTGVFGPTISPKEDGLARDGNALSSTFPLLADGAGHRNTDRDESAIDKGSTKLYRNGRLIGRAEGPLDQVEATMPAAAAKYRLTTSLTRSKPADVTTRLDLDWTFSSAKTSEPTKLPVSVVRFTPKLGTDSRARAGATLSVPVTVQGAATGSRLKKLTVWSSTDGGAHWTKAPVRAGKIKVKNPAAGGTVSFRTTVLDTSGNTGKQTIINAYRTK